MILNLIYPATYNPANGTRVDFINPTLIMVRAEYASGMYLLVIENEDGTTTKKLVKK